MDLWGWIIFWFIAIVVLMTGAVVLIDNEATLKKVYRYPTRLELIAEAPPYLRWNTKVRI